MDDYERLGAMESCLRLERSPPPVFVTVIANSALNLLPELLTYCDESSKQNWETQTLKALDRFLYRTNARKGNCTARQCSPLRRKFM